MANAIVPLPSGPLSHLIATSVKATAAGTTPSAEDLANAVAEVTVESQTLGASLLQVTMNDPNWAILRSGFLNVTADGLLDAIDVNFPQGSDLWWRLAMIDFTNDLSGPNLTLTFQDRIISYLQADWGALAVPPGTTTRAQFLKFLVDRVAKQENVTPLQFVCKSINALTVPGQVNVQVATMPAQTAQALAKSNKTGQIGIGSNLTVKGQPITKAQATALSQMLGVAAQLQAGVLASQAMIFDSIFESDGGVSLGPGHTYGGVLGGAENIFDPLNSVTAEVTAFLQGGQGFQAGGAIALSHTHTDIAYIGSQVTAATPFNSQGYSTQYLSQGFAFSSAIAEATAIVNAYGANQLGSGSQALTGNIAAGSSTTDVATLTRGTAGDPDEDSWTCMQRLAAEVNWPVFSNGDTIYYDPTTVLIEQQPAVYLSLDETGTTWNATDPNSGDVAADVVLDGLDGVIDNTAFLAQQDRKVKGKVQRKSKIRKPSTPTQIRLNMVCGIFDYRAGDVFEFRDSGPLNGRWLVADATRNCLADVHTQFTLAPSTAPNPEPTVTTPASSANTSVTGIGAGGVASSKITDPHTAAGVAEAAKIALNIQQTTHRYHYSEPLADRSSTADLFTVVHMDCSSFATLCYKAAGLPDPSHQGYNPIGFTGSMIPHCKQVSAGAALPGDLCFFGTISNTSHVNVYIGNGQSISMGSEGEPAQGPSAQMGPSGFIGYFRPDVLPAPGATSQSPSLIPGVGSIVSGASGVSSGAVSQTTSQVPGLAEITIPSLFGN